MCLGHIAVLHRLAKRIRSRLVKHLVRPHQRHEILRLAEVDDVVRVPRQHVHRLDVVATRLKLPDLIRADPAFLNQRTAGHHDEKLPLAVVPVLALGDPRLADVHRELPAVDRLEQLREAAALVALHVQRERDLLLGQIA